ncbi:FAD-dependent oxidoreductase [bacterium]|nr:MAG: FAD-dependent oxidoreductase [bacterium]
MARVVVIGGGVIGCAIAERLTLERHHVTLLERDRLGGRASGAAAGELSPQAAGRTLESAARSLRMFPELVARIEKDAGVEAEYRPLPALLPAFDEDEAARLRACGGRWLDAQACRGMAPSLTPDAVGALLLNHAQITPPRFVRALARAAASRGAEIREGTPATGLVVEGGEVRGVRTPSATLEADWVVIAAGPWSSEVASSAGITVDVRPQRGQLAALSSTSVRLTQSIFWSTGYLVPKPDGTVIAGGTEEDSGFDDRPTVAGAASLLSFACRMVPDLGAATLERLWAGLRPVTPDGEPIERLAPGVANLIVATGHHRKGILLSPLAAATVASMIGGSRK